MRSSTHSKVFGNESRTNMSASVEWHTSDALDDNRNSVVNKQEDICGESSLQRMTSRKRWRQNCLFQHDLSKQAAKRVKLNRLSWRDSAPESVASSKLATKERLSVDTNYSTIDSLPKSSFSQNQSDNAPINEVSSNTFTNVVSQIGMPCNISETNDIHGNIKTAVHLKKLKVTVNQSLSMCIQPQSTTSATGESEYHSSSHISTLALFGDSGVVPRYAENRVSILSSADASLRTADSGDVWLDETMQLNLEEDDLMSKDKSLIMLDLRKMRIEISKQEDVISPDEWFLQVDMTEKENTSLASPGSWHEWYIVIDTNIFISSLAFVQDLCNTNFKDVGFPVLVIPWQVIQELDRLQGHSHRSNVTIKAQRAVQYLKANFLAKHPRIRGQTLDANQKHNSSADDVIVSYCMELSRTGRVVLLSSDETLCNNATANGVEALTVEDMQKFRSSEQIVDADGTDYVLESNSELNVPSPNKSFHPVNGSPEVNNIMHRLEVCLISLLDYVLQHEMQKVYRESWVKTVPKKRPWHMQDILACFIKYWIIMFGPALHKNARHLVHLLQNSFTNTTKTISNEHSVTDIEKCIRTSLRFCLLLSSNEYDDLIKDCTKNLNTLLKCCFEACNQLDAGKASNTEQRDKDREVGINNVLAFFNKIWSIVSTFCGCMCEVLKIGHTMEYVKPHRAPSMTDIQNQMPEIFPFVRDLLHYIERILEIPVAQLHTEHPLICEMYNIISSNFLSVDCDLEEQISPEYLTYFCSCPRTRQMLDVARKNFQEYQQLLNEGIYYLVNK